MSRTRSLAGLTLAALLLPVTAWALGPVRADGPMTDLTAAHEALDGADARVQVVPTDDGTLVTLQVTGIDRALAGTTLGAHLHVGGCTSGADTTGGHYNHTAGTATPVIAPDTEVWLDFTVTPGGNGHSIARVPFLVAPDGAGSVVVHANPTNPTTGAAGTKLACIGIDL